MNKFLAVIKAFLGIEAFEKKDGKSILSQEDQDKIKATFGEEALTKALAALKTLKTSDNEEETQTEAQAKEESEGIAALIAGLTAQSAANSQAMQSKIDQFVKENGGLKSAIEKLSKEPEEDPIPEMDTTIPRKEGVATVMKVDTRKPAYAATVEFLKTGRQIMAANEAGDTIDVADLKTEFGTFLNTQRNLEIMKRVMTGFTSAQYMTTKMAITEWRATQALITSVVQQFSPKWTPSGKAKFTPLVIKNRRHKINYPIVPADVLDSYMMHLYDEGLSPDQMPITNYITNELLMPRVLQDIELRMSAKGEFEELDWSAISEGDAGQVPEKSMDGYETILVNAKASADKGINFFDQTINWNTATDQQVLDFINAFVDWINPQYQTNRQPVFCSLDVYKKYKRAYKKIWGAGSGTENTQFGADVIDYSNNTLVPLDGMYNSPILFSTPKENFIKLRHKNEVPNIINDVQRFNYTVKLFGEFWLGIGFAIGEAVFAYVPDGYNPFLAITETWGDADDYQQYNAELPDSGSGSLSGGI
ncbi:MAG: hypothetical protein ABJG41_01405 [Cyclobacteriaceae bacterium]